MSFCPQSWDDPDSSCAGLPANHLRACKGVSAKEGNSVSARGTECHQQESHGRLPPFFTLCRRLVIVLVCAKQFVRNLGTEATVGFRLTIDRDWRLIDWRAFTLSGAESTIK